MVVYLLLYGEISEKYLALAIAKLCEIMNERGELVRFGNSIMHRVNLQTRRMKVMHNLYDYLLYFPNR